MIDTKTAESVLATARSHGADFAELYLERWHRRALRIIDREVKEATSGIQYGAGLRLLYGTDVVYAYTNDLDRKSLVELADTLARLKGGAGSVDTRGGGGLDFRRQQVKGLHQPADPFDTKPKRYRLERLFELDGGARIGPEIKQVESNCLEWEQDVVIANSEGLWVEDRRVRSRMSAMVIASADGETQTGFHAPGSKGLELFDIFPPAEVGRTAAEMAMTNLKGSRAPAGTMPVVIGNASGGVIFHEALGHLLETTSVAKKASALSDLLGEQVASPTVTYIDDGTTPTVGARQSSTTRASRPSGPY